MAGFKGESGKNRNKESIRSEIAGVNAQLAALDVKVQELTQKLPLAEALGGIAIAEEIRELAEQHEVLENQKIALTRQLE